MRLNVKSYSVITIAEYDYPKFETMTYSAHTD